MNRLLATLAPSVFALAAFAAPALAGDVTLTVTGVEARGGPVVASINTEAQFLRAAPLQDRSAPGDVAGDVTLVFTDIPPGEYALLIMHDINENGQFDMGAMGPTDGWAFSNGDQPMMGMPTFEQHKFTVTEDGATLTERMRYGDGR
jgi:uncharacterized protein (DUF2141 family)